MFHPLFAENCSDTIQIQPVFGLYNAELPVGASVAFEYAAAVVYGSLYATSSAGCPAPPMPSTRYCFPPSV
jgi:hypothetical protein